MNKGFKASLLVATLMVGACSHYSDDLTAMGTTMSQPQQAYAALTSPAPNAVEPAAGGTTAGDMNTIMAREYYEMAKFENDKAYDYKAAKTYTNKAMAASKGKTPMPSSISAYDVTPEQAAELKPARSALVAAIKEQNASENQYALAKAQTNFDCWLERAEEATDATHYAQCKEGFEQAMASIVMPAAGEVQEQQASTTPQQQQTIPADHYDVAFAQNGTAIEPQSFTVIEQVGWFLKSRQGEGYTATLAGFSEAKVETEYSRQLVSTRVRVVRDALIGQGIPESKLRPEITAASQQTPSAGRSVQIILVPPVNGASASAPAPAAVPQDMAPAAGPTPMPTPMPSVYPAQGSEVKQAPKIVPNTQFKTN